MGLFRRGKKTKPQAVESSPQRVGIVSGVLSTSADTDPNDETLLSDVVARRFVPDTEDPDPGSKLPPQYAGDEMVREPMTDEPDTAEEVQDSSSGSMRENHLRAVEPLFTDSLATPELEVDTMAHIGRTTIITGNVVAEEDLEIQGTIEGSIRLANHQVSVGIDGHVKASVDAHTVHVTGRITGDVVASELVEVEAGGIIGGDVKAPRIIMHDGAIVVGGLDMSAALPNAGDAIEATARAATEPARPVLKKVESAPADMSEDANA
jgi:cytoskeletal protein CcmA (bactofilin family)